jgi:hypothetical protein
VSAAIIVTLILKYDGSDTAEYDDAMEAAQMSVRFAGDGLAADYEAIRVVDVQVTG